MGSRLMRQAQNEVDSDDEEADADDTNDDLWLGIGLRPAMNEASMPTSG